MVGDDAPEKWHVSKTIPLSLIMILFLQFLGGVVVIVRMDERLSGVEQNQGFLRELVVKLENEADNNSRVANTNRAIIERIDRSLERIADALEVHEADHREENRRDGLP